VIVGSLALFDSALSLFFDLLLGMLNLILDFF